MKTRGVQAKACAIMAGVALALSISLITFSPMAAAEAVTTGDLDPSFGTSGSIVLPEFPFLAPTHSTMLVRPDGKLIVGAQGVPFQLDSSGMPDPSYRWMDGRDTMFRRCISLGGGCQVGSFTLQSDGRVVAGMTFRAFDDGSVRFGVARFNTDGTLDLSFGSEGVGLTDPVIEGNGTSAMALLPDGKILVAASRSPILIGNRLAFARFTQNGTVDNSFGERGVVVTDIDGLARTLLPLADGTVVVVAVVDAGPAAPNAVPKTLLAKLLPSGEFDPSFGNGGSVVVENVAGGSTWPSNAVMQSDGSILVALRHGLEGSPNGIRQFTLMRLWPNGAADNSFGIAGKVVVQVGEDDSEAQAEDLALQGDEKIVVVGTISQVRQPLGFRRIAVARFNRDGSLDPFFAPGGVALAWSNFGADGYAVGIQPSGRIVVAGEVESPPFLSCCDLGVGTWHQSADTAIFGFIGGDAPFVRLIRQAKAIEYYAPSVGDYFVTADAYEIALLDTDSRYVDWARTGLEFRVYSAAADELRPVCRFFSGATYAPKSSHFLTPYAAECDAVKSGVAWLYEGIVFYLELPNTSATCPPHSDALYRLYNNAMGAVPHHRYTASHSVFNQMIEQGWIFEGDAQTGVFACVPMSAE